MTKNPKPKILYLIDGHAQFFRAYYAIRSGMSSPVTQEPTNLTFGFTSMLLKLLREDKPDYLVVAIDVSGDQETFRSELYPEYKANRDKAPDDFHPQVERCLDVLSQMGIPVLGQAGVEADDTIATLVKQLRAQHPDLKIRIVSRDKDLTQLIDDHVEMFDAHKDATVTPSDIFKVEGVEPKHVADILALMGDTSDNIPGVPGIGPKTAANLILQYGTIDNLYDHIDEIKGKKRENLEAFKEQVALSRQLVALIEDVEFDFDLEQAINDPSTLPVEQLLETFRQLGFNRHQDELKKLASGGDEAKEQGKPSMGSGDSGDSGDSGGGFGGGLFDQVQEGQVPRVIDGEYELITTKTRLKELVREIKQAKRFAVDTETTGLDAMQAKLCGVSISLKPKTGFYIPTRSPTPSKHLDTETVIETLRPVLEDPSITKIGHNLKYDLLILRQHGVDLAGQFDPENNDTLPLFDTMVASYVIDATRSSHKMDVLALSLLGHTCIPITELIGKGKNQTTFDTVPLEVACDYAAEDADITLRLHDVMRSQLESTGLKSLFEDVEMPLVEVLAELQFNGIHVDPDELDTQKVRIQERIDTIRQSIIDAAPHPFNPDSPKQLGVALFNKPDQDPPGLGLKVIRRGKTGPSTDQEVLDRLAGDPSIESEIPRLIIEYRQLTKLVNTYLESLKEAINPETKRIHASFNQTVAATGRLSSSDPNLQNIPIRTDVGREIRRAFKADKGNVLISADYSQIELRLLAHLSDDPSLIEAFTAGEDIHRAVAAEVYGVTPEKVTFEQRHSAKMINFGIIYGITPFGLARRLGGEVTNKQAETIISDYKARFTGIDAFLGQCVQEAIEKGYVETILKRRRAVPQVSAANQQIRALGERMAINTVVQGSAADLIKLAMIDLYRTLPESYPGVKMLLQIHDELVFEAPKSQAEEV
ncbi:MAG: DNA polymerase I, partial [Planctomycetota bacterium]|nr:DNA polymerase I [Planctomycetota bacterium]